MYMYLMKRFLKFFLIIIVICFKCNIGFFVLLNFFVVLEIFIFSNIMCYLEVFIFGMFVLEIFMMYINIMI